jgi:N-acetylglucosamine kinase-like BadF-type ATPase
MRYFLGVDLGGTKTHMVIADENGSTVGFGEAGPGNHQDVGYAGMFDALLCALEQALNSASLQRTHICGAGFGIAGYDWPSQKPAMHTCIEQLGLQAPYELVNDAIPGLMAGAQAGWGVNVVSGTGCNCRGWDQTHEHEGRVTGYGVTMGEAAGASELVFHAMHLVGQEWTKRGPHTALSDIFIKYVGAKSLEDLLEGYTEERYAIGAETAPLVFQTAYEGDQAARSLITWAGTELGEMACAVIRQLRFEKLSFDVVLSGSMFEGGALLIDPMRALIQQTAANARLVRLNAPPVLGAVLIGFEQNHLQITPAIRARLAESIAQVKKNTKTESDHG